MTKENILASFVFIQLYLYWYGKSVSVILVSAILVE